MKPVLSTMWSNESSLWAEHVEVLDHRSIAGGLPRWLVAFLRAAHGKEALILRGTVSMRERYRDLVGAAVLRLTPGRTPRVVISDATIEPGSKTMAVTLGRVSWLLPLLSRVLVRAADGRHVTWCVLSRDELDTFPATWGVPRERVVFTPFQHTLHRSLDELAAVDPTGRVWAGGNSLRDYGTFMQAVAGLPVEVRISTSQHLEDVPANVQAEVTTHAGFLWEMAAASVVVVPIAESTRSAGQQTYLNAMAIGKVVIVTDRPGVRDHIVDGVTGVVCPPTVEGIRAAVLDALDPARRGHYERMRAAARAAALEEFSPVAYQETLIRLAAVA